MSSILLNFAELLCVLRVSCDLHDTLIFRMRVAARALNEKSEQKKNPNSSERTLARRLHEQMSRTLS